MQSKPPITIPESEYTLTAVRASGPGGQHVNKVSTAVVLRFNIQNSSLPESLKKRLLALPDRRITDEGEIVIKSGASRSQLKNRQVVVGRLHELVRTAAIPRKRRVPTKPTKSAIEKRLQQKLRRSQIKENRKKLN